jgi:hypothetical protein
MAKIKKFYLIIFVFLFISCQKGNLSDCVVSKGKSITHEIALESFSSIVCYDQVNIFLQQDSTLTSPKVVISGPENVISNLHFDITNDDCKIWLDMTCHFVRSYDYKIDVTLYVKDILGIEIGAAAKLETINILKTSYLKIKHFAFSDMILNLDAGDIEVFLYNASHLTMKGNALSIKGIIDHNADLDARNLDAQKVLLDHHSPLDSYFKASESIYVNMFNVGNFYYYGNPSDYVKIETQKRSGTLIKME